jgi:hypothetical protein
MAHATAARLRRRAAGRRVPSVIVPDDYNVPMSPLHPHTRTIIAVKIRKWLYGPRLAKSD